MTRSPQTLERILAADPLTAAWVKRQRRVSALTQLVRRHLPRTLAGRIRVSEAEGPELVLVAGAGAIAGVARQRAPDLLAALRREGCEFTSIRVRVQVDVGMKDEPKSLMKQIDSASLQPLAKLARELPGGPLRASLARLLRRVG